MRVYIDKLVYHVLDEFYDAVHDKLNYNPEEK